MNLIYLRTSAYAVLAIGLINWTYQSSKAGIVAKVAPLIIFGLLASIFFALKGFRKYAEKKNVGILWLLIALFLVIYAFVI